MNTDDALQKVYELTKQFPLDFELSIWSNGWRAVLFELRGDTFENHEHLPYSMEHESPKEAILGAINKFEKSQPDHPPKNQK